MPVSRNEYNARAMGGTELSIAELERNVEPSLLEGVDIVPGRWRGEVKTDNPLIFWAHDTADDPEMRHLDGGGWRKFDVIVFVSHWQRQQFVSRFGIPWSHTRVIHNAVEVNQPPTFDYRPGDPIRFIYHTTPHRGLDVLVPAFIEAASYLEFPVHMEVYSSFRIYGNPERDSHHVATFDTMRSRPDLFTSHGSVPNEEVRAALRRCHAFVYPCVWPETGCRALIEARVEGVLCATTDLAALPETGGESVFYFPYTERLDDLKRSTVKTIVDMACTIHENTSTDEDLLRHTAVTRSLAVGAASYYTWKFRRIQWERLMRELFS